MLRCRVQLPNKPPLAPHSEIETESTLQITSHIPVSAVLWDGYGPLCVLRPYFAGNAPIKIPIDASGCGLNLATPYGNISVGTIKLPKDKFKGL